MLKDLPSERKFEILLFATILTFVIVDLVACVWKSGFSHGAAIGVVALAYPLSVAVLKRKGDAKVLFLQLAIMALQFAIVIGFRL